jgi:hypothetical protein
MIAVELKSEASMNTRSIIGILTLTTAIAGGDSKVLASGPCPADANCSGGVDVDDLLGVINHWGNIDFNEYDINQSGSVDVDDLLQVINAWGSCVFDFGTEYKNAEAHQIGLEMLSNSQLTLPLATYDRIDRDLDLIRTAYTALADQFHTMAWSPNQLLVAIQQGQPLDEYQCSNTFYQVIDSDFLFNGGSGAWYVLTFDGKVNVEALAAEYTGLPGVNFAEPNGLAGGQNFWKPTDLGNGKWKWEIDDGFMDCFDGCDCHKLYVIVVDGAGNVTQSSYQQVGQTWCEW